MGPGTSSAVQTIDLSAGAAEIDAGRVRFYLAAYLGLGPQVNKLAMLTTTFKHGAGKVLLISHVKGPSHPLKLILCHYVQLQASCFLIAQRGCV
jgi:hypothetical protein